MREEFYVKEINRNIGKYRSKMMRNGKNSTETFIKTK